MMPGEGRARAAHDGRETRWGRRFTAVAALVATACGGGGDGATADAGVRTTVDSTGGVHRTTNAGAPPAWSLEPLLTVANADGEEFGRVTGMAGDWAGNVYVADAMAKRVYRIGPDGALLATLGGEGAGPGEFRALKGLAFVGGRVASLDAGNARITLLAPDGAGEPQSVRWQALSGDVAIVQTAPGEAYAPLALFDEGTGASRRVYLRLIGAGTPDTLEPVAAAPRGASRAVTCEGNGGIHFFAVRYDTGEMLTPAPGGRVLAGNTGRYRLAFLSPGGDTARVFAREIAPAPVSDAEWAEIEREWSEFQERTKGTRCDRTGIERPASKPAFASAFFDDMHRVWVEAWDSAGFRFDVFDSTGVLVGTLPAPARDRSVRPYVRTGKLFYVGLDSLDVQAVHVARIVEDETTAPTP
jgi:hypothetical protein